MVATVKIIPFAVARSLVDEAEQVASAGQIFSFSPSSPFRVGVIATQLPSLKPATMDKTRRVLAERLDPSKSEIVDELRVAHRADAVASALQELEPNSNLLIVFGASAITDRNDVIPAGIE